MRKFRITQLVSIFDDNNFRGYLLKLKSHIARAINLKCNISSHLNKCVSTDNSFKLNVAMDSFQCYILLFE